MLKTELQRAQGRKIPEASTEDHERNLIRLATKGVVELFNTVCEFQDNTIKEAKQEQKDKDLRYQEAVQAVCWEECRPQICLEGRVQN